MGDVVRFHDARASAEAASGSGGYRSGRNSCRGMPETRSTASTRSGGTSSHCEIACSEMPSGLARPANPPTASIARFKGVLSSVMTNSSSTALDVSQAGLHCIPKAKLYAYGMSLGKRILIARRRLHPEVTQQEIADAFDLTGAAVSGWELDKDLPTSDKLPKLRKILKVRYEWLLDGSGPMEELSEIEQNAVDALIAALRGRVA